MALKSSKYVKYVRDLWTYKINNPFLNDNVQLIKRDTLTVSWSYMTRIFSY